MRNFMLLTVLLVLLDGRACRAFRQTSGPERTTKPVGATDNKNHKKRPKWEPLKIAEQIQPKPSKQTSSSATMSFSSNGRKACGVYLWNAWSAYKHHLCLRLVRDKIYEGRGGRRFVRIEPGSLLQLLYPPSNHSPDSCCFCGGSFQDHLELWWSRHFLYSPYDLHLDRTLKQGRTIQMHAMKKKRSKSTRRHKQAASQPQPPLQDVVYAFHRPYVLDLQEPKNERQYSKFKESMGKNGLEQHDNYVVPSGHPSNVLSGLVREMVLVQIDMLMQRQQQENTENLVQRLNKQMFNI